MVHECSVGSEPQLVERENARDAGSLMQSSPDPDTIGVHLKRLFYTIETARK